MSLFNFRMEELLSFFAVLVRYSILFSVLPFIGDRLIPSPIKVLLSLAVTLALFSGLVSSGRIHPEEALVWGKTTAGMAGTIAIEVFFALLLGFTARLIFDSIAFGANLAGNFMGFAAASTYDVHQESQAPVIAQIQTAIAMLVFLAIDGHHLMLRAALDSYKIVGLGKVVFRPLVSQRLIQLTGETILIGFELSAPIAITTFAVNMVFGVLGKAMPNLNIYSISGTLTALIGFGIMFLSAAEYQGEVGILMNKLSDWLTGMMQAMAVGR